MIFPWAFGLYLAGLGMAKSITVYPLQMLAVIAMGIAAGILLRKGRIASIILALCFLPLGVLLGYISGKNVEAEDVHPIYKIYGTESPLRIYGEVLNNSVDIYGKRGILVQTYVVESRDVYKNVSATLLAFMPDENAEFSAGEGISFDCTLGEPSRYLNAYPVAKLGAEVWCYAQRGSIGSYEITNPWRKNFYRFKMSLLGHLQMGLNADYASLFQGVVFGKEARGLSSQVKEDFYSAGISHLVVASGAQVALMIFPFFTLYNRIRSRWARAMLFIIMGCAMLLLLFIVGPASSILRAVSVGFVVLFGRTLGRPTHPLNSLAFAGLLWLVINPELINTASFLLSYSASFGILYMAPILVQAAENRFPRGLRGAPTLMNVFWRLYFWVKRNLIHLGIITVSSQWGVLPIIAWKFGRISLNGILANMFAVPAGSIVLILGALSGALGFIHPFLGLALNLTARPLLALMIYVAHFFGKLDPLSAKKVNMPIAGVIAYYIVSIAVIEISRKGPEVLTILSRLRKGELEKFNP